MVTLPASWTQVPAGIEPLFATHSQVVLPPQVSARVMFTFDVAEPSIRTQKEAA